MIVAQAKVKPRITTAPMLNRMVGSDCSATLGSQWAQVEGSYEDVCGWQNEAQEESQTNAAV
jgi:hypothetical protein